MSALIDSDLFAKLGIAGLLNPLLEILGVESADCRRLPALPHMLRRGRLPRLYGDTACDMLVATAEAMPVAPAATSAWLSRLADVPQIDPGEAQLLACAAEHGLLLVTGDKRALIAVASVDGFTEPLSGRVVSLEAATLALCARLGDEQVRAAVAPLIEKDRSMRIWFSDSNHEPRGAILSYYESLKREVSPLVLWEPR